MILYWLFPPPVSFFGGNDRALYFRNSRHRENASLDLKKYTGLERLKDCGAEKEQLKACHKGFALFEGLKKFGFPDYTDERTTGCIEILETGTAIPKDFSVFFGTAAYLIRHGILNDCEITDLARWQASLIRNNSTPKEVQDATWKRYVA